MMKNQVTLRYDLVIFDWDGTLMDSTQRIISSMQNSAASLLLEIPTASQIKSTIGLSMQKVVSELFPDASPAVHNKVRDFYREEYINGNDTPTELFSSVVGLLEQLEMHSVLLSVATGKGRQGLKRVLDSVGWSNKFEHSICGDEAESKPNPEMLLQLLKQTGVKNHRALMVGDSIHDIAMAEAAGVDAVGVTTGANSRAELEVHKPIAIFDDIAHLSKVVFER
jgi:phosphoglycolate phosphatase